MIKKKVINRPHLLEVGVAEYLNEASCSKLRCKPQYPLVLEEEEEFIPFDIHTMNLEIE